MVLLQLIQRLVMGTGILVPHNSFILSDHSSAVDQVIYHPSYKSHRTAAEGEW